jgi:beta-carotene 15,15'-dioxygenase
MPNSFYFLVFFPTSLTLQRCFHYTITNMMRFILLVVGFLLLIVQQYVQLVPAQWQIAIFLTGIIFLGIPHGAADLLVATRNAENEKKNFSAFFFFVNYLGRLALFGAIIWLFPIVGNVLFILFAAYHFGETDLAQFKTDTILGKLLVTSYGLVILSIILLIHFEEVKPIYQLVDAKMQYIGFISRLEQFKYSLLLFFGLLFSVTAFFYFSNTKTDPHHRIVFFIQFALILFILYRLPMVLGFTFYFVVWHSLLSLRNIINYLRQDNLFSTMLIIKQIGIYSSLAMAGIALFGLSGFMGFISFHDHAVLVYVFLGLAVLTAPHMQIMHDMYKFIQVRQKN